MKSDSYREKVRKAEAFADVYSNVSRRGLSCNMFIISWMLKHEIKGERFVLPEMRFEAIASTNGMSFDFHSGTTRKSPTFAEVSAAFEREWSDESKWRQRLEGDGIPFVDRSEVDSDLWEIIKPYGFICELKSWLEAKPVEGVLETRGRVLLSLTLYNLQRLKSEELFTVKPDRPSVLKPGPQKGLTSNPNSDAVPSPQENSKPNPAADKKRSSRGAPLKSVPDSDARIARRWKEAKAEGTTRPEFAAAHNLNVDELEKLIDRVRQRQRKSQSRPD